MDARMDAGLLAGTVAAVTGALGSRAGFVFERCFRNTLDTTIVDLDDGTSFMVTGDIPAMWLRDSAAQLAPYLHFARHDAALAGTIDRVVRRQLRFMLLDPYANAFNATPSGAGHHDDLTPMSDWVWERKYEVDSLCYPLLLAYDLWAVTGRTGHVDETFRAAARLVLDLWRTEQDHDLHSPYRFQRPGGVASETLRRDGLGAPTARTGLTWSGFRPSDDAVELGFNVPGNAFAVVACRAVARLARLVGDGELARDALDLAVEIDGAIREHGVVTAPDGGPVLAYEVDGTGKALLMDDANVPSLLSLPLIGWCTPDDPLYLATRALVLSDANPYYARGAHAAGVGSPHTPPGRVWPIALAVQGLTTSDASERADLLATLVATDAGTGLMHESFDPDDPGRYSREWFSWANAMFCELALDVTGLRTYRRAEHLAGADV